MSAPASPAPPLAIPVAIPLLLGNATAGAREVTAHGTTLQSALDDLLQQYPLLRVHLFDETGSLRPHVVILYNQQNTRWLEHLNQPLSPGDTLTILQAVSGG